MKTLYSIIGVVVVVVLIVAVWAYTRTSPTNQTATNNPASVGSFIRDLGVSTSTSSSTSSDVAVTDVTTPDSGNVSTDTSSVTSFEGGTGGGSISAVQAETLSQPLFTRAQIISLIPEITDALGQISNKVRQVATVVENDNKAIDNTIKDLSSSASTLQSALSSSNGLSTSQFNRVSDSVRNAQAVVADVTNHRQMIDSGAKLLTILLQQAVNQIAMAR